MKIEELEESKKDLKKLSKKYRTLPDDMEVVQKVLYVSPNERPPFSFRIDKLRIETCVIRVKKITIQRFCRRRKNSTYSQANIERLKWLFENKLIHPSIQPEVLPIIQQKFIFPEDIIKKLRSDTLVWENYQNFSESYKRIRIAYIESARKRPLEFEKRFNNFIRKTKENKLIRGFGGIDKYY